MGNSIDLLKFGAKILIVIAVIGIGLAFFSQGQEITKSSEKDMQGLNQTMQHKKYEPYDGTELSGSQVINAIRQFGETGQLSVSVKTKTNTSGASYSKVNKYKISSPTDLNYINPVASFDGLITRNNNEIVTFLTFAQK